MNETLTALAWQAVATPSLDAQPALDVLVDALLEAGTIRPPWPPSSRYRNERARVRDGVRSRRHLRQQAWAWAKEATVDKARRARRIEQIGQMLDAGLITIPDVTRTTQYALGDDMVDALVAAFQGSPT